MKISNDCFVLYGSYLEEFKIKLDNNLRNF